MNTIEHRCRLKEVCGVGLVQNQAYFRMALLPTMELGLEQVLDYQRYPISPH